MRQFHYITVRGEHINGNGIPLDVRSLLLTFFSRKLFMLALVQQGGIIHKDVEITFEGNPLTLKGDAKCSRKPQRTIISGRKCSMAALCVPCNCRREYRRRMSMPSTTMECWRQVCSTCHGQALVQEQETLRVHIPPMVRDGTVLEAPIRGLGIHHFYVKLHIRVV